MCDARHGGKIDDVAAAIFVGLIAHDAKCRLRTVDGAFCVDVESEVDISRLNIGNEIWAENAGHVHHRIDPRPELGGGLHGLLPLRGVANVELAESELARRSGEGAELLHGS